MDITITDWEFDERLRRSDYSVTYDCDQVLLGWSYTPTWGREEHWYRQDDGKWLLLSLEDN